MPSVRISSWPLVAPVVALALFAVSCGDRPPDAEPADLPPPVAADPPSAVFREVAAASGLDFVHFNGMSGEKYSHEALGGGVALLDYDRDGDLDLYLVQGCMQGRGKTIEDAIFPPRHPLPLTDRLYRNDLEVLADGSRRLRFTDVTERAGFTAHGYGMGVAAGDIDNDGWVDLYVTNFGSNQMWRNRGDGTFEDVTARSGTDDRRWSVAAAMFDYDGDGWLDLFVGNYVDFTTDTNKLCRFETGLVTYCGPLSYPPVPDRLFNNRGDGTFEDATALIRGASAAGTLGVVTGDFDDDGRLDFYVANDALPNHLWLNQGDGTFREDALLAGVAVNMQGDSEGSMGVTAGDFDNDGDEDLFMTHIDRETNTVYVNDGTAYFVDSSVGTGLGTPSHNFTGFGTSWLDFDNDGWLDVVVVNGSVYDLEPLVLAGDSYALHQTNLLFHNLGGKFEEVTGRGGEFFDLSEVSRGLAVGDLDEDGDQDAVVGNNNGPVRLLLNVGAGDAGWLNVLPWGGEPDRPMLGAAVRVATAQGTLRRQVRRDGSYASARDPRVHFGLGRAASVESILVRWPDGRRARWRAVDARRHVTLRRDPGGSRSAS